MQSFKRCGTGFLRLPTSATTPSPLLHRLYTTSCTRYIQDPPRKITHDLRRLRPLLRQPSTRGLSSTVALPAARGDATETPLACGNITSFEQLRENGLVSPAIVDTLVRNMGLSTLTEVQSLTIGEALTGRDLVAQARTGTGKTLAFLIPIVQNIIKQNTSLGMPAGSIPQGRDGQIQALIISPTRELAEQIATEARKLVQNTSLIVRTAVGGTNKMAGLRQIQQGGCNILVGTPGRLKDILSDPTSRVEAPALSTLVLDEADRLLEQGFEEEIRQIQDLLPDKRQVDRQTLLYSATIPRQLMPVVRSTLKRNFKFVQTVQEGETPTHEKVTQKVVNVGSLANQTLTLVELCLREIQNASSETPFKAIIFFPTLNEVELASQILRRFRPPRNGQDKLGIPYSTDVIDLYSKLTQARRTRNAEGFKKAKSAILLSSDVAARGMDFPGVTHVIQMGLPPSEEQYIHRIGRTARAGRSGEAWLLIPDLEQKSLRMRLPQVVRYLNKDRSLLSPSVDLANPVAADLPSNLGQISERLRLSISRVNDESKANAYVTSLSIFSSIPDKKSVVDAVNARALHGWGLDQPPMVSARKASQLGFSERHGIRIGSDFSSRSSSNSRGHGRNEGRGYRGNGRNEIGAHGGSRRYEFDGNGGQGRYESGRYGGHESYDSRTRRYGEPSSYSQRPSQRARYVDTT